jgi:hypothetical protein
LEGRLSSDTLEELLSLTGMPWEHQTMTRWEYCVLTGVAATDDEGFEPALPRLYLFTKDGLELVEAFDDNDEEMTVRDQVARQIARLGNDGWELVGAGTTGGGTGHSLYFKRAMPAPTDGLARFEAEASLPISLAPVEEIMPQPVTTNG